MLVLPDLYYRINRNGINSGMVLYLYKALKFRQSRYGIFTPMKSWATGNHFGWVQKAVVVQAATLKYSYIHTYLPHMNSAFIHFTLYYYIIIYFRLSVKPVK